MAQNLSAQFQLASRSDALLGELLVKETLTERQRREREYYEEYSMLTTPAEVCFDPVLGKELRPWNPYWFLCNSVAARFRSPRQRLLDFGCGPGIYSVIFGKVGYEVFGFDISPNNIAIAQGLAQKYGLSEGVHFRVGTAERIDYPDEYFDVVVGIDILHHVDVAHSVRECLRVLKKGGTAVFKEPVAVPVFDPIRNSLLGRLVAPKSASLERHITEDERKLTVNDLRTIRALCPDMSIKRFRLFSRLEAFNKRLVTDGRPSAIEKFDGCVFQLLPFMKTFGGDIVIALKRN